MMQKQFFPLAFFAALLVTSDAQAALLNAFRHGSTTPILRFTDGEFTFQPNFSGDDNLITITSSTFLSGTFKFPRNVTTDGDAMLILKYLVDDQGDFVSGLPGIDLLITGEIDINGGGTDFSGTLLEAHAAPPRFNRSIFEPSGDDLRFAGFINVTGGELSPRTLLLSDGTERGGFFRFGENRLHSFAGRVLGSGAANFGDFGSNSSWGGTVPRLSVIAMPEPTSFATLAIGLVGLFGYRIRRRVR